MGIAVFNALAVPSAPGTVPAYFQPAPALAIPVALMPAGMGLGASGFALA